MDLFLRLLWVVCRAFLSKKGDHVLTGSELTLSVSFLDRSLNGMFHPSRVSSFTDLAVMNFFVRTGGAAIIRRKGWMPIIIGSQRISHDQLGKLKKVSIHSCVKGWSGEYFHMENTWRVDGQPVLVYHLLTRLIASDKSKVTGEDMIREMGLDLEHQDLLPLMRDMKAEYEAQKQAGR